MDHLQLKTDELSSLFGLLDSLISIESRDRIVSHPDYRTAFNKRDGCRLWNIMYATHQVSNLFLNEYQMREEASRRYYTFYQTKNTSVAEYYEQFKNNLKGMKEVGCHIPKKAEAVSRFISGLNNELFGELKNQLANASHFNLQQPPDLPAAFALASNFIPTAPRSQSLRSVFHTSVEKRSDEKVPRKFHKSKRNTASSKPTNNKPKLKCNYCSLTNHTEDKCFKKIRDARNQTTNNTDFIETFLPSFNAEVSVVEASPIDDPAHVTQSTPDQSILDVVVDTTIIKEDDSKVVLLDTCAVINICESKSTYQPQHLPNHHESEWYQQE